MRLEGKTAVVTGASSGIGKAIALMYAREGCQVVAVARREWLLEEVAKTAEEEGSARIIPFKADVTHQDEIEAALDCCVKEFGKLDIMLNCAGIGDCAVPIGDETNEGFQKVMDTNLMGAFYSCRKAVNIMLDQGYGNIINVSSLGGLHSGLAGGVAYTTSKFALVGLSKNLGFMYIPKNIRCNAICPGLVDTPILHSLDGANEFGLTRVNASKNLAVMGQPDDIAYLAVYLGSDESKFMTATAIEIDGGWGAY